MLSQKNKGLQHEGNDVWMKLCFNIACLFLAIAMETWGQAQKSDLQKSILLVQLTHFTKCKLKKVQFSMHTEIASLRTAVKKISVSTRNGLYV